MSSLAMAACGGREGGLSAHYVVMIITNSEPTVSCVLTTTTAMTDKLTDTKVIMTAGQIGSKVTAQ